MLWLLSYLFYDIFISIKFSLWNHAWLWVHLPHTWFHRYQLRHDTVIRNAVAVSHPSPIQRPIVGTNMRQRRSISHLQSPTSEVVAAAAAAIVAQQVHYRYKSLMTRRDASGMRVFERRNDDATLLWSRRRSANFSSNGHRGKNWTTKSMELYRMLTAYIS